MRGARQRIQAFEEMAATTKHARAASVVALANARYIIETEEWKVQPVAENASNETMLANGVERRAHRRHRNGRENGRGCAAKTSRAGGDAGAGGAHADHGAAPRRRRPRGAVADDGKSPRIMHRELARSSR